MGSVGSESSYPDPTAPLHGLVERGQGRAQGDHPLGQGLAADADLRAPQDFHQTIQGQMIGELGIEHIGQQAFIGRTALDDGIGQGGGAHTQVGILAGGVFGPDILDDVELFGLAGQLAADLLADTHQRLSRFRAEFLFRRHIEFHALDRQVVGVAQGVGAAVFDRLAPLVADFLGGFGRRNENRPAKMSMVTEKCTSFGN